MRIPRLYLNQSLALNSDIQIEHEMQHYIVRVLRLKINFLLHVFNSADGEFLARITHISKHHLNIKLEKLISEANHNESPLIIHLGQALSKGKRMDYVIQKATELGVNEITPVITERTELKLDSESTESRLSRWQTIIISACEQCGRNQIPIINPPAPLNTWLDTLTNYYKIVLSPTATSALQLSKSINRIAALIGPEGGLSTDELTVVEQQDFHTISLGPRILRTETAPLALLSILQFQAGDLG